MSSTAKVQAIPALVEVAQVFPKRRLLVVGNLVADHYIYGQTDRVSREAPVLIVRYESSEVKLGGAANAAANARSLGGQVLVVGALGADEMGDELRRQFKGAGIKLLAVRSKKLQTETKTRILAGGGNTAGQQMLRLGPGGGDLASRQRVKRPRPNAAAAQNTETGVSSGYSGSGLGDEQMR